MRSQAMKAGEVEALNEVLNNVSKVDAAIEDFRQRLPAARASFPGASCPDLFQDIG